MGFYFNDLQVFLQPSQLCFSWMVNRLPVCTGESPRWLLPVSTWHSIPLFHKDPLLVTLLGTRDMHACVLSHFNLVRPTLCDPIECSLPGSSVRGILQARILEWVAMPSSRDLPYPGIELVSLMSPALAGGFFTTSATWEAHRGHSQLWTWPLPMTPLDTFP